MSTDVHGSYEERFASLVELFAGNLSSGEELGAALAITIDDELVVDVWGGWSDGARTQPWVRDTIVNVWSSTKTVTSLAALMLIDRGLLDPEATVASYWPEFSVGGKGGVTVAHVLSHSSGVSGWEQPATVSMLYDWETSVERLAEQEPWWEPGTSSGYHSLTFGHLVGELVRRVSGLSLKQFIADEVAGPLGADFTVGSPESAWNRISDVVPPTPLTIDFSSLDPESVMMKTETGPSLDAAEANTPAWRNADIGAANGHGNARSLAQIHSVLSNGGASRGHRLLSSETIDRVFKVRTSGVDQVIALPVRFGLGFALTESQTFPYLPDARICHWGGWGGSYVINDLDRHLTATYVMNKMAPDVEGIVGSDRGAAYLTTLYTCVS